MLAETRRWTTRDLKTEDDCDSERGKHRVMENDGKGRISIDRKENVQGFILVLDKKLSKLFIAPKVRQELHETAFVAFCHKRATRIAVPS